MLTAQAKSIIKKDKTASEAHKIFIEYSIDKKNPVTNKRKYQNF